MLIAAIVTISMAWATLAMGTRRMWDLVATVIGTTAFVGLLVFLTQETPLIEFVNTESFWDSWLVRVSVGLVYLGLTVAVVLFLGGLLWAPFAASACRGAAETEGLDQNRYADAGARYSAQLFLPWIHLMAHMRNRNLPRVLILAGYAVMYFSWLGLLMGSYVSFVLVETLPYHRWRSGAGLEGTEEVIAIWFITITLCIFGFISSVLRLRQTYAQRDLRRAHAQSLSERYGAPEDPFPDRAYLYPFRLLLLWIVMFPIVWAITYAITSP